MRRQGLVGVALAALALSGCGSDEQAPESSTGTASSAESASSESPTESPTDSPTGSPTETPTVAPATGAVLEVEGIALRLPKKWRVGYDTSVAATAQGPQGFMGLSVIAGDPLSLRALVERDLKSAGPMETMRRLPDRTLGGNPAYHYEGRDRHDVRHAVGTWDDGYQVLIHFELEEEIPRAERRELFESVIATYTSA